jgi:hypothetical protein
MEDRSRGRDKEGKPLNLPATHGGGTVLAFDINDGDTRLSMTMADGQLGSIEIAPAAVDCVADALRAVVTAIPWRGSARFATF